MAYAEFVRGYRLGSSGDPTLLGESRSASEQMRSTRDPAFFPSAMRALSLVWRGLVTMRFDPASEWLEKAEFQLPPRRLNWIRICPKGTSASAFSCYGGPSKNFQHLEAIAELKRALALQNNQTARLQPSGYNPGRNIGLAGPRS